MKKPVKLKYLILLLTMFLISGFRHLDAAADQGDQSTVYTVKDGFIDVHGLFLYYMELGEGQPLVILHGGPGGSHGYFLPYLLPLARTNRIIFMDERGSGRSGKLTDPSGYTVENMADDVEALRHALGLQSISLLGHSYGGVVAQAYALKYQQNLSHLILANTFDSTRELNEILAEYKAKIAPEQLKRIEMLEKEGLFGKGKLWEHGRYPAEYAELVGGWFYFPMFYEEHTNPNFNPSSFGVAWDVYREMSGSDGEFVIDGNMTSVEYADKLKTVHVPTLIIEGEHDVVSLGMAREMHANIAGSQLTVLPRTKHYTFVDQTELFNQAVDEFIHSQSASLQKHPLMKNKRPSRSRVRFYFLN